MDNNTNVPEHAGDFGKCCKPKPWGRKKFHKHSHGCIYFFAFIGAAVYFLQNSHTFWTSVLAILKAMVWPAFLIYKLLQFLKV